MTPQRRKELRQEEEGEKNNIRETTDSHIVRTELNARRLAKPDDSDATTKVLDGFDKVPSSPVAEYDSFTEVLIETKDVTIIDLSSVARGVCKDKLAMLYSPPEGIFIAGQIEPIINFSKGEKAFAVTSIVDGVIVSKEPIQSFEQFLQHDGFIVNDRDRIICRNPKRTRHGFLAQPDISPSLLWLIVISAWDTLRSLTTLTSPRTRIQPAYLLEQNWIQPEFLQDMEIGFEPSVQKMLRDLNTFIGRDHYAQYSIDVKGLSLVIEKGNDFRVIEYYRAIFENYEDERMEKFGF